MTHVAHPYVQRIGVNRDWKSRWFTTDAKKFREYIRADAAIRKLLEKKLKGMSIDTVEIERSQKDLRIIIKTARPGLVIGRSGEGATKLKKELDMLLRTLKLIDKPEIKLDVEEVRSPESSANIVGQMIAEGLEKRLTFRRVMKQTIEKVMANRDVEGVRIILSGRLGGADMARKEELKKGRIPLQTLRADIDFARVTARLPYGAIGIKVWIYRGQVFADRKANPAEAAPRTTRPARNA
ncbi:30S ribosomal protein S3 [Candidatus Kaiserbacteria bacterium RIFCSPLOWO2_02_FULL_45_11b]|uniref:Small ribosomal subunit protein uS3 n=1 Tax=Candidatus Kaiserbacteria bacterium RIFCSPLOWO2_12_FULL_45_26 TaxID=1798525 RepID=A0A1F6FFS1_9BACT|nr:MAG: 30S ribosomal protein S3 [Candidatus Kaiserbacteria bacterium RIFCSPHIGHO2_12_45_16]OGG70439.1 MAG: 30S ribosomal protein S3 [Candidatus Kaiserbacteria bacterium RIFCSPLOWO2_01_FULL_45_25]OGG80970.1 MAG: 30S ribosomal protein S3 [Candidatus Kaiserbacteria bacterium RIFCSPLOWO2_02_FULL_45_11b]OGG84711.1 MAG: 30S ribosomal protein S3 [Candidatus Kaiserbacteria bacterium RIFCSPLOWO2_12_FULL_45_26]